MNVFDKAFAIATFCLLVVYLLIVIIAFLDIVCHLRLFRVRIIHHHYQRNNAEQTEYELSENAKGILIFVNFVSILFTVLFVAYLTLRGVIFVIGSGVSSITPTFIEQYQNGNMPFYIALIAGVILMLFYKNHKVAALVGGALVLTAATHWIFPSKWP